MSERQDWYLLKAAHKALYDEHWPRNLRRETVQHGRCLRSSELLTLKYHWSQAHFKTVPLSVLTPSRLQWYYFGKGRQYKKCTSEPRICLTYKSVDFLFLAIQFMNC